MTRYAIYWAPAPATSLARSAARWLGYDAYTGAAQPRPDLAGLAAEIVAAITEAPRHYGFHATLKPPFELAGGESERALLDAVERVAAAFPAVAIPPLVVAAIDRFLALVPRQAARGAAAIAERCVRDLDRFRAPLSPDALERRRRVPLSQRQERYLAEWGYPFVLDEFRFHLTLTDRLSPELMRLVRPPLEEEMAAACRAPTKLDQLVVFREVEPEAPMRVIASFVLAAPLTARGVPHGSTTVGASRR